MGRQALPRSCVGDVHTLFIGLKDPRTPRLGRSITGGGAYAISPVSFIPEFMPILCDLGDASPLLVWLAQALRRYGP